MLEKEKIEEKISEIEEEIQENSTEIKEDIIRESLSKIYIGPTIDRYNLQENTVFISGYPSNVEEAIEQYPIIKKLLIDVKNILERNKEEYKAYYEILLQEIGGK